MQLIWVFNWLIFPFAKNLIITACTAVWIYGQKSAACQFSQLKWAKFQKSGQTVFLMNVYLIPLKIQFNGNKSQISQKYIRSYKPGPERHHEVVQPSQFPQNA